MVLENRRVQRSKHIGLLALCFFVFFPQMVCANNIRLFAIDDWYGWIGFEFINDFEERENEGSSDIYSREGSYFFETIHLGARGSIYHPRLLAWAFTGEFGLTQNYYEDSLRTEFSHVTNKWNTDDNIYDYRIDLYFLREHPFSFNLFMSSRNLVINRQLRERFVLEDESAGGSMMFRIPGFKSEAGFTVRESIGNRLGQIVDETYDIGKFNMESKLGPFSMELDYRYDRYQESNMALDETVHDAFLELNIDLPGDSRNGSWFFARYNKQEGDYNSQSIMAHELFRYAIHPKLKLKVDIEINEDEYEGIDSSRNEYQLELISPLSETLRILSLTDFSEIEYGDNQRKEWSQEIGADYKYETEAYRFTAAGRYRFRSTRSESKSGLNTVSNERHRFDSFDRVTLYEDRIRESSLVVRDEIGTFIYEKDRDYLVQQLNERTVLIRLAGGLIPEESVIKVSYQYEIPGTLEYDTHLARFSTGFSLGNAFLVYYNLWISEHDPKTGAAENVLEDYVHHQVGLDYHWKLFSVRGQYEDKDSRLYPMKGYSLDLSASHDINRSFKVGGDVGYQHYRYDWSDNDVKTMYLIFRSSGRISNHTRLVFTSSWRQDRSNTVHLKNWENQLDFNWSYRALFFETGVLYRRFWKNGDLRTDRLIQMELRRMF